MYHWIIAAIVLPVPFVHLWLHAFLSFWRRQPVVFYLWSVFLFVGAFLGVSHVDQILPVAFYPGVMIWWSGIVFIIFGVLLVFTSMFTLGVKRFFVWSVLRPSASTEVKISSGIFRFFPHPAYFGYLLIAFGNLLSSGKVYLMGVMIILLAFTPIVILFEEAELHQRKEVKL